MTESVYLALGVALIAFLSGYILGRYPCIGERLDYVEKETLIRWE